MSEREKGFKTAGLFTPGIFLSIVKKSKDKYYKGQNVQGQILQRTKYPENKYYKGQNVQGTNITKDKMSREQNE